MTGASFSCSCAARHRGLFLFFAVLCLIPSSACNKQGPARITISGAVTLDGVPLKAGGVAFLPVDPALGAAGGEVVDGSFTVTVFKGPHRVEVNALTVKPDNNEGVPINTIPRRYNGQTTLTFDVQSAKDQPRFDLVSEK
jgi:hypothetical protein